MRKAVLSALLLLGAIALLACGREVALEVRDPAPEFTLQDTTGKAISLNVFRDGDPALLFFHMAVG